MKYYAKTKIATWKIIGSHTQRFVFDVVYDLVLNKLIIDKVLYFGKIEYLKMCLCRL